MNSSSLPDPDLFIVAASTLAIDCWKAIAMLEHQIFRNENAVLTSAVQCVANSWYWFGIAGNVKAKLLSQDGQELTESSVIMRSPLVHNQKSVSRLKFSVGRYIIRLTNLDHKIVRSIGIIVLPRKSCLSKPIQTDKQGRNLAILVPDNTSWITSRVKSLLTQHQFSLVDSGTCVHLYQRNLTLQWTVAVITYGNSVGQDLTFMNCLRLASEALVLFERDDPFETVTLLDRVVQFMDLTVKGKTCQRLTTTLDALKERERMTLKLLKAISMTNKMVIGAATVGTTEYNQAMLDRLLLEWIVLPAGLARKNVYLQFSYVSSNSLFTEEVAKQFTDEILPSGEYQLYAIRSDPQVHVYVSCPVQRIWSLATGIEEVFKQFPTLSSVQEIFIADIATLATVNDDLADMKLDMLEDAVPGASDTKFFWTRDRSISPFPQSSLASSITAKH